jgi:hypothetical protein
MAPHDRPRMTGAETHAVHALRDLVRQTIIAGASRRVALLHMDQLPASLQKPHYQRLARNAVAGLSDRDHAQSFDLSRGRLAVAWRSRSPQELEPVMAGLEQLTSDLPRDQIVPMGQLMSVFDLPAQAPWLLDHLGETALADGPVQATARELDPALLAKLEETLVQADLSQFLRWRPVMQVDGAAPALAWEDRIISASELAACLCPGRHLDEASWLFRRLARTIDRRMLAVMTGPRELAGNRPFAMPISVASIVSPAFLAFDSALPAGLRGKIVLALEAADILSDTSCFVFARNFAHTRGYALLLRGNAAAVSGPSLINDQAAGLDYVELHLTPELQAAPAGLPDRARLVLTQVDDAAQWDWTRSQHCRRARGLAVPM